MSVQSEGSGSRKTVRDSDTARDENVGDKASLKIALSFYYDITTIIIIISHGK